MIFSCEWKRNKKVERWTGKIVHLHKYSSHYEIFIESRSTIMVVVGKTSRGLFACIPDFQAGCHLVDLNDNFWNTESLIRVLKNVDGITVASALHFLSDRLKF
jgi:hypothetical protein